MIDALFGFWREAKEEADAEAVKRNRLLSYWNHLFDLPICSPKEFYAEVEKNLEDRKVPDLQHWHMLMQEKSLLSRSRLYLQMRRERLVFEICAAPFGTGFFVSSRLFDRRRVATLWDYVFFLGILFVLMFYINSQSDFVISIVIVGFLITTLWSAMRLAATDTVKWLDERLYVMPLVGPIYESWFHPLTYFREDQNNMYREVVHRAVMETIGSISSEKGIKPLTEDEKKPLIWELFRK